VRIETKNNSTEQTSMKRFMHKLASHGRIAAVAAAVIAAGASLAFSPADSENSKTPPVRLVVDQKPVQRNGGFTTSFAPVVKGVAPSVVQVYVSSRPNNDAPNLPLNDPFFRHFFGDQFNERQRGGAGPRQQGLGSGVIVTKDGYILTNNHVVEKADDIKVALNDGREFKARVVGADAKTDIAVLKIDEDNLPYLPIADSDQTQVGDVVLAIGNPFGVGQTVTMGIVSATGRGNMGLDYEDFIQTDAAINPGNSGGPLVDAEGRLIGINTAILSRSGGNHGIGFAIPVNLARNVMDSLVNEGRVVRGYIGVTIQDLTPELAKQFNAQDHHGALVAEVASDGPAGKAGVQSGDVIVEFNGKPVRDSRQLKLNVAGTKPGKKVPMKVVRDGKEKALSITLKELPGQKVASNDGGSTDSSAALDGVVVQDLDPAIKRELNVPATISGAVVASVDENSPAFEAGLRRGDIIQEINRKPVKNAHEAIELSEKISGDKILLRVWSRGGSRFIAVDESKAKEGLS
jgi:serine protease Do